MFLHVFSHVVAMPRCRGHHACVWVLCSCHAWSFDLHTIALPLQGEFQEWGIAGEGCTANRGSSGIVS